MSKSSAFLLLALLSAACGPPSRHDRGGGGGGGGGSSDAGLEVDAGDPADGGGLPCGGACGPNQICDRGECVEIDPEVDAGTRECASRYDCPDHLVCRGGTCETPPESCNSDLDCVRGELCSFTKRCEPGCVDPRDCDAPQLCHPQRFVCEACSASNPCPVGQACLNGACQTSQTCASTQDCVSRGQDGTICLNGRCASCATHADCNVAPYTSQSRVCASDGLCRGVTCTDQSCREQKGERAYCDTASNTCKERECLSDGHCPGTDVCDPSRLECVAATCSGQAAQDCQTQCGNQSMTCNMATCACEGGSTGACALPTDCASAEVCFIGMCTEQAVHPLTGQPCDAFTCATCVGSVTSKPCDSTCMIGGLFGDGVPCP